MADKGKKKIKLTLKYDILKYDKQDCKTAIDFIAANKELAKLVKPLEFKVDAELDGRKWDAKKLEDVVYYGDKGGVFGIRMSVKMFDMAVDEAKKKNRPGDVKKAYSDLEKDSSYAFEKLMKDIESGKADNAEALKKGKEAMNKLKAIQFKGAFEGPRSKALSVLAPLAKDEPPKGAAKKAASELAKVKSSFDAVGKEAQNAVDFLLKTAKTQSKDDAIDASLKKFYEDVLGYEDKLSPFNKGCEEFIAALEDAIEATKSDEADAEAIKEIVETLEGLSSLDKDAQTAVGTVNRDILPKFKKIESKLK